MSNGSYFACNSCGKTADEVEVLVGVGARMEVCLYNESIVFFASLLIKWSVGPEATPRHEEARMWNG